MLALQKYRNKKIAIYGMGITGCSVAKTLRESGAKIFCWDDKKEIRRKIKKFNFNINKFWSNKFFFDNIVISPGIDINKCKIKKYLKKNYHKVITDLDLFFEINKKAIIISITGTNGKSTTCKLIEKILKTAKFNVCTLGNIGNPLLSLKRISKKNIFILEVSSYQLEYSKLFRSRYAAILNISPDHLERHKNIKNYIKIKSKIFLAQNSSDYSYINSKNMYSKQIKTIFKSKKIKSKLISINKSNYSHFIKKIDNKYFESKGNIENLAFAYEIVRKLKVSNNDIIKALNRFKGLPHRQEIVFSRKNLICINDSKATSYDACEQSLSNYDKIYWILGGIPKQQDKFFLKNKKKKIVKAYIVGNNISFFKNKIKNIIPYTVSNTIKNAVNNIYNDLKLKKDYRNTILLSPAAASFDQFANFESRGNHFKSLIIKKFNKG